MRRFVTVDVETTGLDPERDVVIEVGLVVEVDEGFRTEEFSLPFDKSLANPEALRINGWGQRDFPEEMSPQDAAYHLQLVLSNCHLVGKNPSFDAGFLKALLGTYGLGPSWHHRLVDVGALAWGCHSAWMMERGESPRPQPPSVDQVAEMVDVPRSLKDGYHTALDDALWAYRVFREVVPR
jgi:DNA polymerase III epsilon subunit-like protein